MYKIVESLTLTADIFQFEVKSDRIAKTCEPGQFVIVRADENGERIPLTISDYNRKDGTIKLVFQVVGASTHALSLLKTGDSLKDIAGPLGKCSSFVNEPQENLKQKRFLFVAGGVGCAPVFPQVKWLTGNGVTADVIIGFRNKSLVIMESEMEEVATKLYVTTDDGSHGYHGQVTAMIKELCQAGQSYDICIAIGPTVMMKYVALLTKELGIPTIVSMNPVMVDGTGMCGACRLTVDGEVKFACVDGPEFDGHMVDFDEAMMRLGQYHSEEKAAYRAAIAE
ncbi:MAG: sulfide/dihydroorotate dehydrogenase-like FAD/NAD-binding protein [Lachnospiraceae bacterium]|jgi:ferredoxin--NADP+ reductase|nr:sulfide/dihydroorotate dehydrogenase-like FAD/NAD-binding protein [Lachnospiraceae bacterium]